MNGDSEILLTLFLLNDVMFCWNQNFLLSGCNSLLSEFENQKGCDVNDVEVKDMSMAELLRNYK
jgi:hypothetical protein